MRAIIATDFRGTLRKVLWLTENRTGVSAGICERAPDPHATYHVDGMYHHRVRSKGRLLTIAPEKRTPIRSIADQTQLFGTAAFYSEAIMNRLPVFKPNRRVDALLVLGQSVFSDIACAFFNIYIIHRSHEAKFVAEAYSFYRISRSWLLLLTCSVYKFSPTTSSELLYTRARNHPAPNQAMQPTAGRRTASVFMINTRSFQVSLALASGG